MEKETRIKKEPQNVDWNDFPVIIFYTVDDKNMISPKRTFSMATVLIYADKLSSLSRMDWTHNLDRKKSFTFFDS